MRLRLKARARGPARRPAAQCPPAPPAPPRAAALGNPYAPCYGPARTRADLRRGREEKPET